MNPEKYTLYANLFIIKSVIKINYDICVIYKKREKVFGFIYEKKRCVNVPRILEPVVFAIKKTFIQ